MNKYILNATKQITNILKRNIAIRLFLDTLIFLHFLIISIIIIVIQKISMNIDNPNGKVSVPPFPSIKKILLQISPIISDRTYSAMMTYPNIFNVSLPLQHTIAAQMIIIILIT